MGLADFDAAFFIFIFFKNVLKIYFCKKMFLKNRKIEKTPLLGIDRVKTGSTSPRL